MTQTTERRKGRRPPLVLDLETADWSARGAVSATAADRTIPVQRALPGEHVIAEVHRGRPWRGIARDVLRPAPERIEPPCPYYARDCGGCQWQHMTYDAQVITKRRLVDREMERAGVDIRVGRAERMKEPWRYRRTAALAIGWEAGFRPLLRRGIVEIHDCPISHSSIGGLADEINRLLRSGAIPNYHGRVWLDCTVVGSDTEPALQVLIQGISGLTLEEHPELPDVAQRVASLPGVASVAYRHRSGRPVPLVGDLMSRIEIGGRDMWLPAGSFVQTNLVMVPHVMQRMQALLQERAATEAADIYGGVGTFGLTLAPSVGHMTLIELDPLAVEAARRTAGEWRLENVSFVSRHAERALPELPPLDAAIVDPPRSGLGVTVTSALTANRVPLILYVSCAPPSLADDLAAFQGDGYRITSLDIFDFYPQTYHVESLAVLERC
ncbi:MAG TPA: 23S rRNA (uracil(1939)-C(5))-methyltransferase RlmD [Chloroflexota bacterium]|nr:23S rRNA (uracil(1939)-C(5))-methyltransferase RlmD [Chloroflexota bacterium]